MIRMIQNRSASHAKSYFSQALAKSDYYVNDQELAGVWQGKLAARLGIRGQADKDSFFALCENRHPVTGDKLTPRNKGDRTTGYDINFHCPKSVSLLHVLSGDGAVLKVFQDSVTDTMNVIEQDAKTRVRKDGQQDDRNTGELVWAQFIHQTARPVEGHAPDPHLHAHCFTFNATWDDLEQKIKAAKFRDIKRDMPYYQALFHKTLSDRLTALGYDIRRTDKSFEVGGIDQSVIDLFSKRTDEIGRVAREKGITDVNELSELGARTRGKKQKGATMTDLKKKWLAQIETIAGNDYQIVKTCSPPPAQRTGLTADACIEHALLHSFERASVMQERRLLETALRHSIGDAHVSVPAISQKFESDRKIIRIKKDGNILCTTKEVLAEEKRMVELAKQGQGAVMPLYKEMPPLSLGGQQAAAVEHILTTTNRVSIVRGAAGTGKTTLMKEAVSLIEHAGKTVTVVAPTANASRGVLKAEGFQEADTVAKLLLDTNMQAQLKGQVLWVDEAGLLGTKDMLGLLHLATKNNARLILGGDTKQHASVIRGDALRILNTVAGIKSAEVSKIYRQKNVQYKDAVNDLSKGNVKDGFDKLDKMGVVKESDPMKQNEMLVKEYVEKLQAGKTALVISPTHKQGDVVTDHIRTRLRQKKMIGTKEITATRYINLNLTEAEKKDARRFQKGWIIQFNQNTKSFVRGSQWRVEGASEQAVKIINDKGERKKLPLTLVGKYDVFIESAIGVSKGDKIRFTRNAFDENKKRLNNGQTLDVASVSRRGKIVLRGAAGNTYTIDKSFGHIAHAHVVTSHASQGKTVDEVFISQPASTFAATDAKQFYVSVSRGRDKAHIYTDDKEALLQAAREIGERQSAIELISHRRKSKEITQQKISAAYSKFLNDNAKKKVSKNKDYEFEI